ncbi:MAG: type II toxin-antitoxin system RelB/DinJ family antitoxin [Clostridia bacterium]|nr:type II toxin-antitoxin system RelB/DinJ family antitoxin [Clostridia bacterium]
MAQTLINLRIDEDVKKNMEQTCKELGITMSAAFNIFARKMCREKRIPFEVSLDPFFSESNIKAIQESVKQLEEGKIIEKTLEELEEMEDE